MPWIAAGCGFRLRGAADIPEPLQRLRVTGTDRYGRLQVDLRRELAAQGIEVVEEGEHATAHLEILQARSRRRVLSRGAAGRAAEYELSYQVVFRVLNPEGEPLLEEQEVQLARHYSFDPAMVLARDDEEEMLEEDMRRNAINQIVRRLEGARERPPEDG